MLFTKVSPVGVDIPIQKLQTHLHDKLLGVWGIDTSLYHAYGRCYRNQKDAGYVAEVYTGLNEYREVYLDDRLAALSFFGLTGDVDYNIVNRADVHLIFWVNVERLKQLAHRGDEEVRKDVQVIAKDKLFGFTLSGLRLGIDRVLQEYRGMTSQSTPDGLKFRDMHPFHCFRFDFSLQYDIKHC